MQAELRYLTGSGVFLPCSNPGATLLKRLIPSSTEVAGLNPTSRISLSTSAQVAYTPRRAGDDHWIANLMGLVCQIIGGILLVRLSPIRLGWYVFRNITFLYNNYTVSHIFL